MGARKRLTATNRKAEREGVTQAKLVGIPTSPRKMRLVADLIRGRKVNDALNILKFQTKHASIPLEKLLLSAIANWQNKNTGKKIEEVELFVKTIHVGQGATLKRMRPAPQGRGHRVRKRSNHVTIIIEDIANNKLVTTEIQTKETTQNNK